MTTSWSRSPLQFLRYSWDNIKRLHKLSKCCGCRCGWIIIGLWFNVCQNPQFGYAILLISFTEVVGCIPTFRLCQFVKLHRLLPKPLNVLLYRVGGCAHHPAVFVIFSQIALLWLFVIHIFPILPIVGTFKIAHTVSDSNHHLPKHLFWLAGHQSRVFSSPHIFLPLPNCCLCIINSRSYPSGFSLNDILDPFLFLFFPWEVCLSLFLGLKLLFGSQAAQCPNGSVCFCFQASLALIRLMTLSCGLLCGFALCASWKCQKDLFRSVAHCSFCWLCCWARCWMLQDMDNMEARCVFYDEVGTFNHLE